MREELQILAKQINYKELHFAKFKLSYSDKEINITLNKGKKYMSIHYNKGADLYDVRCFQVKGLADLKLKEESIGIYAEQLKGMIQEFFRFEYVFHKLGVKI